MTRTLYAVLTLAFLLTAALSAQALQTYSNQDFHFSFDYPIDWDNQSTDDELFILANLEEEMPVVITVMAEPLTSEDLQMEFDALMQDAMTEIRQNLKDMGMGDIEVIASGDTLLAEQRAHRLDLRISILDTIFMLMDNLIVPNGDNLIFLSYTAESGVHDQHLPVFAALKQSLRLLPAE